MNARSRRRLGERGGFAFEEGHLEPATGAGKHPGHVYMRNSATGEEEGGQVPALVQGAFRQS